LSVIVCTRNGADKLPIALDSLARQSVPHATFEVIVIDDGSTDETVAVAERRGVRVVRLPENAGLGAARNAGVSAARAHLVAFTDDDCEAAATWVGELLAAFEEPEVDAVGGRVIPEAPPGFAREFLRSNNPLIPLESEILAKTKLGDRLGRYLLKSAFGRSEPTEAVYSVVGANMAFRRDVIVELGGFDEAFRFASEEEDMCRRLHQRPGGALIRYRNAACVTHWFESSVRDTLRRSRAYGHGNARSALKHPEARIIVYPFPIAIAIALGLTLRFRRRSIPALGVLPWLLYPRWISSAASARSVRPLAYPPVQLAQELSSMYGEIEGLRAGYRPVPPTHLRHSAAANDD
jgi:glycosyltransferase involved in cell wall biosynthesis